MQGGRCQRRPSSRNAVICSWCAHLPWVFRGTSKGITIVQKQLKAAVRIEF